MNVTAIAATPRKIHAVATHTRGTLPLCMPYGGRRTRYRPTNDQVTCARCTALAGIEPPQHVKDMRDVVLMAQLTVDHADQAVKYAERAVRSTTRGSTAGLIAEAALLAARAAYAPAAGAWHSTIAAFVVMARRARVDGYRFPLDHIEKTYVTIPQVAALIAAHEAN